MLSDQSQYHFLFLLSAKTLEIKSNSIILKDLDPKVLYMTARPGRDRAFVSANHFMSTWISNNSAFLADPPQIAFISSSMKTDSDKIGQAISLSLENPKKVDLTSYHFDLKTSLSQETYQEITFFIDWPARTICPQPIQLLLPCIFKGEK